MRKNGKNVLKCREMFCAWMKKRKKNKIKYPKTLEDCKEIYDKDGIYRYVIIVSLVKQVPLFMCETYEEAEETIKSFRKVGLYPMAKIVDLDGYGEWKSEYDKEPICKE